MKTLKNQLINLIRSIDQLMMVVPENFKRSMLTKMNKLSNKGWSYHSRLLRLDQHAISYFRNIPKDYDGKYQQIYLKF